MSEHSPINKVWDQFEGSRENVPVASCIIQGRVLQFKSKLQTQCPPPGLRKSITDFSARSRLAMLKEMQKINFEDHPEPLFMTLTYPDDLAEPDHATRNIHRKVMARHLEKTTGVHIPAAWRVEWAARKTGLKIGTYCPHWHWLIFGHRYIGWEDVNALWCKTIGTSEYARTEIKRVPRSDAVPMYMAKYISKDAVSCSLVLAANQNRLGRQFGWLRKKEIPRHPEHRHSRLSDADRATLHRLAEEKLPWITEGLEQSFTLFGDVAQDAQKLLTGETLDGI